MKAFKYNIDTKNKTYLTTDFEYKVLCNNLNNNISIATNEIFPPLFNIKNFNFNKSNVDIAIINGFGNGIGVTIQGLTFLNILISFFEQNNIKVNFYIYLREIQQDRYSLDVIQKLFDLFQIKKIQFLPIDIDVIKTQDYIIDNSGFTADVTYNTLPIVDYFLNKCGFDINSFDNKHKENSFLRKQTNFMQY